MQILVADLPAFVAALILIVLIPGLAIGVVLFVHRRVGFEALVVNNEVAGFKYATLGVAYAVLVTFLMVAVWEKFDEAQAAIDDEATALFGLHHFADVMPPDQRAGVHGAMADYINAVIDTELPLMQEGRTRFGADSETLQRLLRSVLDTATSDAGSDAVLETMVEAYHTIADARSRRIDAAKGSLTPILWWLVVLGGLITVGFTFFFGSANVPARAAMTGLLSSVIMSLVFTTVMMNHPFVGDIAVDLGAYEALRGLIDPTFRPPGPA